MQDNRRLRKGVLYFKLQQCLTSYVQIVEDILKNQSKASSLSGDAWKKLITRWKADIEAVNDKAAKLKTQASSQPGRAYGQVS